MMEVPIKQRVKSTEYNPNKRRYAKENGERKLSAFLMANVTRDTFSAKKTAP